MLALTDQLIGRLSRCCLISPLTSLQCIFTPYYKTNEILTRHQLWRRTTSGRKGVFNSFCLMAGLRWLRNNVVWFRCFSVVATFQFLAAILVYSLALSWGTRPSTVHSSIFLSSSHLLSVLYWISLFSSDIRLDWESYNILPQDNQLLDMLVFVGQPFPVIQDGQEVVPAVQEQDCYLCEEKPFIQVKLREHEGARANRPFEVTPSQQVWLTAPC